MYLKSQELEELASNLSTHFEKIALLMDCYTPLAARMSRYKNPVHHVGVTQVFGVKNPDFLHRQGLPCLAEHPMTPDSFLKELQGLERLIFAKLYAGNFSKKLYRLFEYGN